jgi:hypothetical protein
MAMTPVKKPLYPDVPPSPGVPPVKRDPLVTINKIGLLAADVLTVIRMFQPPEWGIFTIQGQPLVVPDTVTAVDFRREARISDYPVEDGGFQSYDKVLIPYDARVSMTCDGTGMDKSLFLANIDAASQSLDLFTVVTPEVTFTNMNVIHYDLRRERTRGATILHVDVWLQQIVQTATTQFTDTSKPTPPTQPAPTTNATEPTGVPDVSKGTVQPAAPPQGLPVPPIPPLGGGGPVVVPFD